MHQGRRVWRVVRPRGAASLLLVPASVMLLTLPLLPSPQAAGAGGAVSAKARPAALRVAAPATGPRIAFTDDRDQIVTLGGGAGTSDSVGAGSVTRVTHEGEVAINARGTRAFVSTKDQAQGDVYVSGLPGASGVEVRVTCDNAALETHPVVSPDGTKVAYASNESGAFQIWVAWLYGDGPVPSPSGGDVPTPTCTSILRRQLTHSAGQNLWPSWVGESGLVFSSTRADPLGDIYQMPIGSFTSAPPESDAVRLTDGKAAETQPAYATVPSYPVNLLEVVFTTTAYRPDGSLALLSLPGEGDAGPRPVRSAWPGSGPQSSEAAWSPGTGQIAYTSTEDDPYGDVFRVNVPAVFDGSPLVLDHASRTTVSGIAGVAESHAAWVFEGDGESDPIIEVTRRVNNADVSDVLAADGSDRRTIAARTTPGGEGGPVSWDESSPSYSPDGTRVAYSRAVAESDPVRHEIVTAAADGSDVKVLLDGRTADGREHVDLEPSWSPDGTRIAFVRVPDNGVGGYDPSQIWVADLAAGTAHRVSVAAPETEVYWDEDPSWSLDGRRLVIGRQVAPLHPDIAVGLAANPPVIPTGGLTTLTATVTNGGRGPAAAIELALDLPVGLTVTSAPNGCATASTVTTCPLGSLAQGGSRTLDVSARRMATGDLHVTAHVVTSSPDVQLSNNDASLDIGELLQPDVGVTLTANPDFVGDQGTTTLSARVRNAGPGTAEGVVTELVVPIGLTVTQRPGCDQVGTVVTCRLGAIAQGATKTVDIVAQKVAFGLLTVRASATATSPDANMDNNNASATVGDSVINVRPRESSQTRTQRGPQGAAVAAARAAPTGPPADAVPELWVVDATTGAGARLGLPLSSTCPPTGPCESPLLGRSPAWSPGGLDIAFERLGAVQLAHLKHTGSDGRPDQPESVTSVTPVTGFKADGTPMPSRAAISVAEDPAWSPDGSELAIAGQPAGQPDQRGIYALKPDGTGLRTIAQERGPETEPAWQRVLAPPPGESRADVSVTLTVAPNPAFVGGPTKVTVVVRNNGPGAATGIQLLLAYPAPVTATGVPTCLDGTAACLVGTLAVGGTRTFVATLTSTAAVTGDVTATVTSSTTDPVLPNNKVTVRLVVKQPVIRLLPPIGPPGFVTLAYGESFPPLTRVTLRWSVGLNQNTTTSYLVAADGALRQPVLVFPRDELGERKILADSTTGLFSQVSGPMLVVPSSVEPPNFVGRG